MNLKCVLVFSVAFLAGCLIQAHDAAKSISGIVTTRVVAPDDNTVAFILANPGEPAVQELAAKGTCLACHNPDTKLVGPAYRDFAASYRNDPDAVNKLAVIDPKIDSSSVCKNYC